MAELLTVDQVAEKLNLKPDTVRMKIRDGKIPGFFKMDAGGWRIDKEDLQKYIENSKKRFAK